MNVEFEQYAGLIYLYDNTFLSNIDEYKNESD